MKRRQLLIWWTGLFAALLGVTAPVWIEHPILGFDDFALIEPLRSVHSFADYARLWNQNVILDLQPVRDFVYWLQIWFGLWSGFENFQLVNVFLWFGCIVVLWRVIGLLKVPSPWREIVCSLVALHPVMHNAVMWAAGTKHVLSALFIMLSLFFLMRWRRPADLAWSWIFYVLAVSSQPINIGFPIFALTSIWLSDHRRSVGAWIYLGFSFAFAAFAGALNSLYFSSKAYANTGGLFAPKFRHEDWVLVWKRFLILGRDAVQIILPYKPSVVSYNLQAPESFIGLGLILILALAGWRWSNRVQCRWLLFILLPISAVVVKLTSQGGVDTYLLTPLLGLGIIFSCFLTVPIRHTRNRIFPCAFTLVLIFLFVDFRLAHAWGDKRELWVYAYHSEQSTTAKIFYAQVLVNDINPDTKLAIEISDTLIGAGVDPRELDYILAKAIFVSRDGPDSKLNNFERHNYGTPWLSYYWSALDASRGNYGAGHERLLKNWKLTPRIFVILLGSHLEEFETKWLRMCQLSQESDCSEIHKIVTREAETMRSASRW